MAYLTKEQRSILREIISGSYKSGLKGRERRKARNSAIATGLVESNLRNLSGGDRDSQGWRQERKQYYSNPTNVRAAVGRFYQEYKADAPKHGTLGQRAQAVQQSGFPDRYDQVAAEARRLGKLFDKGGRGAGKSGSFGAAGRTRRPSYIPGRDSFDTKGFLIDNLVGKPVKGRLEHSATSALLHELSNPASPYRKTSPSQLRGGTVEQDKKRGGKMQLNLSGTPESIRKHGKGKIFEVFYDPAGEYYDSGKLVKGAIGGHSDHVHVSAGKKYVVMLGKYAQRMGLHVGENSHFGGVAPVHTNGSFHYKDEAIDVSGDPKLMAKFAKLARDLARR